MPAQGGGTEIKMKNINKNAIMLRIIESQYTESQNTDKTFNADAEYKYSGIADKSIRFIERVQLLDTELWTMIANQFTFNPDDEDNGWRCEYWGKIMRGACEIYKYTKSEKLYNTLEKATEDIIATAEESGRISTYSVENEFHGWDMWGRKYVLLGLLHFYDICRSKEFKQKILDTMCAHVDYILRFLGDGKIKITDTSEIWQSVNSCSILEPIIRLYNITKNEKYLEFSRHIIDCGFAKECNLIELAYENKIIPAKYPVIKAYEIMSCFEGLIEYYRVTGVEKYRTAAENFVKALIDTEDTIIGCLGCKGEYFDNAAVTQANDEHSRHMQETCVTVTWMKLCLQMYRLTGEIEYIEHIEKSYYNAMLGSVNTKLAKNEIGVFPFDSYSQLVIDHRGEGMGGLKEMKGHHYGCCAAIGAMGLGIIPQISMMSDNEGCIFNLYENGEININMPSGERFCIKEHTLYPTDDKIFFEMHTSQNVKMNIKFRIPEWADNAKVKICGDEYPAESGKYFMADREWKNGDKVELVFGAKLKKLEISNGLSGSDEICHIAFKMGALVLARDLRFDSSTGEKITKGDYEIEIKDRFTDDYILLCEVKSKDEILKMIDYASAGKTLDEKSMMEAWMSVKA